MQSFNVKAGEEYSGTIPDGAMRLILTMGEQGHGEVTIGSAEDKQHLYYGRNEYVVTDNATSYTIESEAPLSVVEDFVYMPATVDEYVKNAVDAATKDMKTQLQDHETRITALEARPPNPNGGPPAVPAV